VSAYAPLHRDEVDGKIVLIRMRGDCWRVARDQSECDFVRNYEVQSPSKRRLGLTGLSADCHFIRVERIDEEPIERPDHPTSPHRAGGTK
jgi:hypothetical protein